MAERPDVIFHLAAIVSGEAEADFDLGMRINIDAFRLLLETCRALPHAVRGDLTQLPDLLVARCLASEALLARQWLIDLWRLLRPALLGREAVAPRIWST